jgi:hypothetical protein
MLKLWGRVFKFIAGNSGDDAAIFSKHNFECSITYSSKGEPGKCSGSISYISKGTFERFIQTTAPTFQVIAGYTNFYGSVFTGVPLLGGIKEVNNKGVPSVEFDLLSGSVLPKAVNVQEPAGVNVYTLLKILAKEAGYSIRKYEADKNKTLPTGYSLNGNFNLALKGIANHINCYPIITDDMIDLVKEDGIGKDTEFLLSSDNKIIYSFSSAKDTDKGTVYSIKTAVLWSLRPGQLIRCDIRNRVNREVTSFKLLVTDVSFNLSPDEFSTSLKGIQVA